MNQMETGSVDFVIVTALKIERDAILKRLDSYKPIQDDFEPITYYYGSLSIPSSGENYTVVVIMLLDMGNDEAAVGTTRAIQRWQPANVLMVGIAGGVPKKVALGDVVVADFCYYYEQAKLTTEGDERRSKQFDCDRLLYGRAKAYEASEWKGQINIDRPGTASVKLKLPEAHFGAIGSGEKVVADTKTLPQLRKECPKLLAVAMEGAGVARAAVSHTKPPRFLEVRGICDFANPKKNDKWQVYAANSASAFTIGLLRSRPLPPIETIKNSTVKPDTSIMVICTQSLRRIGPEELSDVLKVEFKGRKVETVSLDFTDLVVNGSLVDPEAAAQRLANPQGKLFGALARRNETELVFHGIAHIPLLTLAGHLVTDRQPVRLFDFHPSPGSDTWFWPDNKQPFPLLEAHGLPKRASRHAKEVVIRVSVSYLANKLQTQVVVPHPAFEIDLVPAEPEKNVVRNIVRSEEQVRNYGQVFRKTIDTIANRFPSVKRIHLFYAGPVSLAFHIGQQISENIHPPVVVWNYKQVYEWGIDLAAAYRGENCIIRPETQGNKK